MLNNDPQIDLLSRQLDIAGLRHRVIAQNIANVNTPNYRQLKVSFDQAFTRELDRQQFAQALQVQPEVTEGEGGAVRADGNNVDIDVELAELTKNTLLFRTYAQLMTTRLTLLRTAITGR
jgi:flagellar basal-body rod protein FlgB